MKQDRNDTNVLVEETKDRPLSTAELVDKREHAEATAPAGEHQLSPLMSTETAEEFRSRWTNIQAGFVDEPRKAVEQADSLVAEVMQHLAKTFADERQNLEGQWGRGGDASTEDLRIALQRYRSFFSRLLSV